MRLLNRRNIRYFLAFAVAVFAFLLTPSAILRAEEAQYVIGDKVNFRLAPSVDSEKLAVLETGTPIAIVGSMGDWSKIEYKNIQGFVKSEYIMKKSELAALTAKSAAKRTAPASAGASVGSAGYSASPSVGSVEHIYWTEAKKLIPLHVSLKITDIRTGAVYYVKSFSNGNHSDVEPVTAEDTAIMKKTYGGAWSWDGRPVIVTVNGRSFAAAINGMPHGGGVIAGNGMNGQVCLHFKGSTVHNGNLSYAREMQAAVQSAWDSALN